jgi:outer membrane protein assembly factor BamD
MHVRDFATRLTLGLVGAALLVSASSCASGGGPSPDAQLQPDRFLFERGTEALERRRWLQAREYFRTLVDTYPTSEHRQNAKLGIGDSYLGERRTESDILAASEFREFLRFYPLTARADYAQYKLALSQVRQVLSPERDQTATREALRELDTFISTYPGSQYLPEVLKLQRETRDRLSESELLVSRYYFRVRHYIGTIARLEELMKVDPSYSRRDALYYYLAESYYRMNRKSDAKPLFERLVHDFKVSEYLDEAQQRVSELSAEPTAASPAATAGATPPASDPPAGAPSPTAPASSGSQQTQTQTPASTGGASSTRAAPSTTPPAAAGR